MSSSKDALVGDLTVRTHKFMMELYRLLGVHHRNFVFSPFCILAGLVLVSLGSKADTEQELQDHISLPEQSGPVTKAIKRILKNIAGERAFAWIIQVFFAKTYDPLRDDYKNRFEKFMKSFPQKVDFRNYPDDIGTMEINYWVSRETENRIPDVIPAGFLDGTSKLVLLSAMDLRGTWLKQFKKKDTKKEKFFTSDDSFFEVDMMHTTAELLYCENSIHSFKVLQLPFQIPDLQMMIFLPNDIGGLPSFDERFLQLDLTEVSNSMKKSTVHVVLPQFKYEALYELSETLKKLGIRTMFDHAKADLTGMHELTEDRLHVSKVAHKVIIEIQENYDEVGADEGMAGSSSGPTALPLPAYNFTANHPFIFCILYKEIPLFVGKMAKEFETYNGPGV